MPAYSHRDHRAFRRAYQLLALVSAGTILLIAVGLTAPWPVVGAWAVPGLAVLGGLATFASDKIVERYLSDRRLVARGEPVSPVVRVEVLSRIELERPLFVGGRASPHRRRPRVGAAPMPAGAVGVAESG